jgi:hypothetical protein
MDSYLPKTVECYLPITNGFSDLTTGQLLQVDGIFVQKTFANKV